jgi:hypothetical protein
MRLQIAFLCFATVCAQFCKAGTLQWDSTNPPCVLLNTTFGMGVHDSAADEIWLVAEINEVIYESKWTNHMSWSGGGPQGCMVSGSFFAYMTDYSYPFEAESCTAYGEWDQIYALVPILNSPDPIGAVAVDNHYRNAVIVKPPEESVTITVRYGASDPNGDLRGIRPQKWNASDNVLESNGGVFETVTGYSAEIVRTYTITDPGDYYFWLDMRDARLQANNTHASTAAWQSGYHITVKNENHAPNVVLDSVTVSGTGSISGNGWAADQEDGAPVSRVEIWLDGVHEMNASLGGDRPDVALDFNRSDYRYSGYNFILSANNLQPGQHELLAKAFDSEGLSSECQGFLTYVPPNTPPPAPQGFSATALASYSIRLDWQAVTGSGITYELHRWNTASGYQLLASLAGGITGHVDTGLDAVTAYTYRIRAVSSANGPSAFSSDAVATTLNQSQDPADFSGWAQAHGLDPNAPNADTDGDGISNYNEYLMGTNPLSPGSGFHLIIAGPGGGYLGINTNSWEIAPANM